MKQVAIAAAVVGALMAGHGTASAQAKAGDKEILVFGNVTTLFGGSTFTHGSVFFNGGQFLTDSFEIGGGPTLSITGSSEGTTFDAGLNAFVRRYLGEESSRVKPYVGGEYTLRSLNPAEGQSVLDSQYVAAIAGVKNYLTERTAIDFKGAYGFMPQHVTDAQLFNFSVGLTVLF